MKSRALIVSILVAASASCDGGNTPARSESEPSDQAAPARDSNVFTPLTDTIDRAESVQSTVDEHAAELERRIEEDEQ